MTQVNHLHRNTATSSISGCRDPPSQKHIQEYTPPVFTHCSPSLFIQKPAHRGVIIQNIFLQPGLITPHSIHLCCVLTLRLTASGLTVLIAIKVRADLTFFLLATSTSPVFDVGSYFEHYLGFLKKSSISYNPLSWLHITKDYQQNKSLKQQSVETSEKLFYNT